MFEIFPEINNKKEFKIVNLDSRILSFLAKLFQQIYKADAVDHVNQKKRAKMGDHHESTVKIFLNLLKKKTPQIFCSPSVQGVKIIKLSENNRKYET